MWVDLFFQISGSPKASWCYSTFVCVCPVRREHHWMLQIGGVYGAIWTSDFLKKCSTVKPWFQVRLYEIPSIENRWSFSGNFLGPPRRPQCSIIPYVLETTELRPGDKISCPTFCWGRKNPFVLSWSTDITRGTCVEVAGSKAQIKHGDPTASPQGVAGWVLWRQHWDRVGHAGSLLEINTCRNEEEDRGLRKGQCQTPNRPSKALANDTGKLGT